MYSNSFVQAPKFYDCAVYVGKYGVHRGRQFGKYGVL